MFERFRIYIFLAFLCITFACFSPLFASPENIINILLSSATIGLLAIGATLVIGAAGLDLSVGSILALSASVSAVLNLPWPLAILICLLTGILTGGINGLIITFIKIPAFIVTLGMLSIARGLALVFTDGRPFYGLPEEIVFIGQGSFLEIPIPIWIFLVTGLLMHILLRHTVIGAQLLCLGDNETAVYNAGVNVNKLKIKLYALSGLLAALAGLVFMGRVNAADPSAGLMYELTAITAAILGGTNLFGGRASVIGAMLGALTISVLQNGLTLLAIPSYYQQVAIGIVLILALSFEREK